MFIKKMASVTMALTLGLSIIGCSKSQPKDVAAEVNGAKISMTDFYKQYANQYNNSLAQYGEEALNQKSAQGQMTFKQVLADNALKGLVDLEIIKQDAAKSKIEVTDEEAKKEIENFKTRVGGEEAYKTALEKVNLPEEYYENQIKTQLLFNKYTQAKLKEFTPKDDEIKKYYDDHKDEFFTAKASHILVDNLQEANKIRKEILKGGDFAKIAKEKSQDTGSKEKGGELGEFKNGTMVKEFNDAIIEMKVGDIHEPIKSDFGYHVIKLEDKKQRELNDELKEELKNTITQEKFTEYMQKLEKDAKVKNYLNTKKDIDIPEKYKEFGLDKEALEARQKKTESTQKTNDASKDQKDTKEAKAEEKK